jgi:hypothetical protein
MNVNLLLLLILGSLIFVGLCYLSIFLCEQIKGWDEVGSHIELETTYVVGLVGFVVKFFKTYDLFFSIGNGVGLGAIYFLLVSIAVVIRRSINPKDTFKVVFGRAAVLGLVCIIISLFYS